MGTGMNHIGARHLGMSLAVLDPEDLTADTPYVLMLDEDTVSID